MHWRQVAMDLGKRRRHARPNSGQPTEFEKFSLGDVFVARGGWIGETANRCLRVSYLLTTLRPWARSQRNRAKPDLAQAIGIKCVGKEDADADEDEECRYDFGHSLPPCIAMPGRARLRNAR